MTEDNERETVRLRATWTVEYDADPRHYAPNGRPDLSVTPESMAEMDASSEDPYPIFLEADHVSLKIEPVQP